MNINNNNNNNLGAMKTPTPVFRPTYPGDSCTNYLMYSTTKYSPSVVQKLGLDNTCEVCPKPVTKAVSMQVHRRFTSTRRVECLSRDERRPILLLFTCDDHANAKAFYELTDNKFKSFLVLGTGPAPKRHESFIESCTDYDDMPGLEPPGIPFDSSDDDDDDEYDSSDDEEESSAILPDH